MVPFSFIFIQLTASLRDIVNVKRLDAQLQIWLWLRRSSRGLTQQLKVVLRCVKPWKVITCNLLKKELGVLINYLGGSLSGRWWAVYLWRAWLLTEPKRCPEKKRFLGLRLRGKQDLCTYKRILNSSFITLKMINNATYWSWGKERLNIEVEAPSPLSPLSAGMLVCFTSSSEGSGVTLNSRSDNLLCVLWVHCKILKLPTVPCSSWSGLIGLLLSAPIDCR